MLSYVDPRLSIVITRKLNKDFESWYVLFSKCIPNAIFYIEIIRYFKKGRYVFMNTVTSLFPFRNFIKLWLWRNSKNPNLTNTRHFPHRPTHRTLDKSSVFIYLNFKIHLILLMKGVMHVIRFDLRFLIGYCIAAK